MMVRRGRMFPLPLTTPGSPASFSAALPTVVEVPLEQRKRHTPIPVRAGSSDSSSQKSGFWRADVTDQETRGRGPGDWKGRGGGQGQGLE